jgi:hypothetical protein
MRASFLTVLFALVCGFPVLAQDDELPLPKPQPKLKKNEVGIVLENQFGNLSNNFEGFFNVIYKKWHTENWGVRFIGSWGGYSEQNAGPGTVINDTIYHLDNHTKMNVYALGVGLDAQRQFYKKVYLTAACELRGGYGKGNIMSNMTQEYFDQNDYRHVQYYSSSNIGDASMFFLSVTPYIGAKFQFKRLCVGMELSLLQTTFRNVNYTATRSTGMFDFYAGDLAHRAFLTYRF